MLVVVRHVKPFMLPDIVYKACDQKDADCWKALHSFEFEEKLFVENLSEQEIYDIENPDLDEFDACYSAWCD